MIAKDVTAQYVEGWDWILPVPDRNTGIWDHVELCFTGPVRLQVYCLFVLSKEGPSCILPLLLSWCGAARGACVTKSKGALCMQDAYAYVTRVQRDEPLSERALLHAEVTAVNSVGRCLSGRLDIDIALCEGSAERKEDVHSAGCNSSACVLQWTEAVSLPTCRAVLKLQPQLLNSPALWWPIHMGPQA